MYIIGELPHNVFCCPVKMPERISNGDRGNPISVNCESGETFLKFGIPRNAGMSTIELIQTAIIVEQQYINKVSFDLTKKALYVFV
ncbi:hypothetical protein GCM10007377_09810 [Galliscardovia ingluviei]|uniref:Uncharacterized protein n=1 Tax=Galliscardovia ingluviei TaxID=1769422 RepID=A0A8J3AIR7_9BIFI|nr:hypothetical protein GCM10007377_09810 [Galliscardovia ingluviei]